jgi:hypothetical protein
VKRQSILSYGSSKFRGGSWRPQPSELGLAYTLRFYLNFNNNLNKVMHLDEKANLDLN